MLILVLHNIVVCKDCFYFDKKKFKKIHTFSPSK